MENKIILFIYYYIIYSYLELAVIFIFSVFILFYWTSCYVLLF